MTTVGERVSKLEEGYRFICGDISEMKGDVKEIKQSINGKLESLNKEINSLNNFKWKLIGISIGVTGTISILIDLGFRLIK